MLVSILFLLSSTVCLGSDSYKSSEAMVAFVCGPSFHSHSALSSTSGGSGFTAKTAESSTPLGDVSHPSVRVFNSPWLKTATTTDQIISLLLAEYTDHKTDIYLNENVDDCVNATWIYVSTKHASS